MNEQGRGVLIIDADRSYRDRIESILAGEGLSIHLADSMARACERSLPPALVLLDLGLPESDGLANVDYWLGLEIPPRVIVLSDAAAQEQVLDALRRGASDYLAKPLHAEELRLAVRRGLESWSVAQNLRGMEAQLARLAVRSEDLWREVDAARGSTDVDELIHRGVVEMVCDVLHAQRASLLRLDPTGSQLTLMASAGERRAPQSVVAIDSGQGVSGLILRNREARLVTDMGADKELAAWVQPERYLSRSFLAIPISGSDGIETLLFVSEPLGRKAFGPGDLSLARLAAQPLAQRLLEPAEFGVEDDLVSSSAMDFETDLEGLSSPNLAALNADVLPKLDAEEELDRDAEVAREICQAVSDEVDPSRVISIALMRVAALLPAAPVSLYVVDPSTGALRCECSVDGGVCEDRTELLPQRGLTGVVFQTGQLVASADPASDPRFDSEVDTPLSGASQPFLCLPLRLRGKTVGLFRAFLPEVDRISSRTGEVLAAALSAALRSVLLYRSLVVSIEEVAEARRGARD